MKILQDSIDNGCHTVIAEDDHGSIGIGSSREEALANAHDSGLTVAMEQNMSAYDKPWFDWYENR